MKLPRKTPSDATTNNSPPKLPRARLPAPDDPYSLIEFGSSLDEVIAATARLDYQNLVKLTEGFTMAQIEAIDKWSGKHLAAERLRSRIRVGAVLLLHHSACFRRQEWTELFARLIAEYGLCKTEAYESMRVFRNFAGRLLGEEALRRRLPLRSLIELSREKATDAARNEAIAIARDGQQVDIDLARSLVRRHADAGADTPAQAPQPNSAGLELPAPAKPTKPDAVTTGRKRPRSKPAFEYDTDNFCLALWGRNEKRLSDEQVIDFLTLTLERLRRLPPMVAVWWATWGATYG